LRQELKRHHHTERVAGSLGLLTMFAILACNAYLIRAGRSIGLEILAIWLPSLVGAVHAFNSRRHLVQRLASIKEFSAQLRIVQNHLLKLAPTDAPDLAEDRVRDEFRAMLTGLCKIVGQHGQRQLQFALAEEPELPV
ncbi:MAG TPA: hypothetical protein VKU41_19270, partial [Polyangiaceae bacterium]|nr:hypothetical protein [Polyangiaceae bacterium]